ncbi:MAG: PDZ domain-containing protein [Gammaproteobacteria bacterium]|nr:PDZ domain-containing protein [Gammaproteobacteria bacterium]MDH5240322.1 PDZ domain-containing protein [Gammaproteobacteria bacterium]MDH5261085.1 PDZ domain-containing protein [Gammaproteobacteria bacterium]
MKTWKTLLPIAASLLLAGQVHAQSDDETKRLEAEQRKAEYSERLRAAEERMEQAAREIAEITRERLPSMAQYESRFELWNKPRIGITIESNEKSGKVDGVEVGGVTPESAADDAGLRAGDIITAVNGESLSAESSFDSNQRLLDFMKGLKEGEQIKLDYLRNGKPESVELTPRVMQMHAFSWAPGGEQGRMPMAPDRPFAPEAMEKFQLKFGFPFAGGAWGSMELVALNKGLGRYFGTDSGLLVVSAPKIEGIDLQDGDVIQSIDGRAPTDVRHCLRILGSYESGETLELGIMRDKKQRTVKVEVPADPHSSLMKPRPVKPARAPVRPVPPPDTAST